MHKTISKKLIKKKAKEFDVQLILRLDLSHCNLSSMEGLMDCRCMISLDLSHNKLCNMEDVSDLIKLERLDLSFNYLKKIINPKPISNEQNDKTERPENNLSLLKFEGNQITDIKDLSHLTIFRNLRELSFRILSSSEKRNFEHSNPLCNDQYYISYVCKVLPQLLLLDKECLRLRQAAGLNRNKNYSFNQIKKGFEEDKTAIIDAIRDFNDKIQTRNHIDWDAVAD